MATAAFLRRAALPVTRRVAAEVLRRPAPHFPGKSIACCIRAASVHSAADSHLVESLKIEIEDQLRQEASQGAVKGSPGPFQIVDEAGREDVVLQREFGKEKVHVSAWVELEEAEEEREDDESDDPVPCLFMVVTLTKEVEKPALEIRCCYYRDSPDITVEHVAYLTDGRTPDTHVSPGPYEAPGFDSLDDNLQQAFFDLLRPRGINTKFAAYIMDYVLAKERREYMRWLQNVQNFFQS